MNFNERTTALLHAPLSPLTWDSMWRECQAIEDDNPYIPSGYLWVLEYKRYKIEMERGNSWQATRHLRKAIALTPYADELVREYVRLCRKESAIQTLALIVTCKKNEAKALELARHFDASQIEYAIITGSDTAAIVHPRAVQVDTPDNYESLGRKVAAGCCWVYEHLSPQIGVLKVSDDMLVENPATLARALAHLKQQNVYAGIPATMGIEHDRCRHWGKCEDEELNHRTYSRPYYRAWADGNAYFLAPGPLEKLVLSLIRFPAQFDGEYYEDKLVGDVLMFEGVSLNGFEDYAEIGMVCNNSPAQAGDDAVVMQMESARGSAAI